MLTMYVQNTWKEGLKLAGQMKFKFPTMVSTSMDSLIPNASSDGIELINQMLIWDPQHRVTATQVGSFMLMGWQGVLVATVFVLEKINVQRQSVM